MLFREYPTYYEDAAHIVRFLSDNGGKMIIGSDMHTELRIVANRLHLLTLVEVSQADEGAKLVRHLFGYHLDRSQQKRLNAIAGTLIGNFLVNNRRPQKSER